MKLLVTGAGGFLGRHVVAALVARGHQVRALLRPASAPPAEWPAGVEIFRGDLRAARELEPAFDGVDALVHLAASVTGGEDAQFFSTVVGTERLLDCMSRTACRRLVLASSFSVYDWSNIRGALDEGSPLETAPDLYQRDGYSIAKSWQERVTRRMAEKHGWSLTVLRPGFIWGRGHADIAAIGLDLGRVLVVIGPTHRIPMTHVENCADAFALAATDARAAGQTFNVVDGPGERVWTYCGDYLARSGIRKLRIPAPYPLVYAAIWLLYATLFRRNPKLPHVLVPVRLESRLKPLRFGSRRLRELLGWRPALDYRAARERTYGAAPAP